MERREILKRLLSGLTLGGLLFLVGCDKEDSPRGLGNQERLWRFLDGQAKAEEPVELAYSKGTPAMYRDSSMGKEDPSFVPKISGG